MFFLKKQKKWRKKKEKFLLKAKTIIKIKKILRKTKNFLVMTKKKPIDKDYYPQLKKNSSTILKSI